jgi:Chaperone of endosialidase
MVRVLLALVLAASGTSASAQSLGTFRWRTEPYCNVISVTVTPIGGVYALDGFDEQCGGNPKQPVRGVALPQTDGTITIGVGVVLVPGGKPVNVEATINQATVSGTWRDSAGNSGPFTFNPTATSGGPRPGPVPPTPLPNAIVTQPQGGFAAIADPTQPTPAIPASGPGRRMMWHAAKGAFRAGQASATEWDEANVGLNSAAFGERSVASGRASFAAGLGAVASGAHGIALGFETLAGTGGVAMGYRAQAGIGSFSFADSSSGTPFPSGQNEFNVRAAGGVGFSSNSALTAGVELKPGASAWSSVSDVNRKENFTDLDGEDVLTKLATMPIRVWNYKAQDAAIRHVGPTAQDFAAAFGLGEDPLRISTIDADGIALRAIQALEARTREENVALKAQLVALQARLDRLDPARR